MANDKKKLPVGGSLEAPCDLVCCFACGWCQVCSIYDILSGSCCVYITCRLLLIAPNDATLRYAVRPRLSLAGGLPSRAPSPPGGRGEGVSSPRGRSRSGLTPYGHPAPFLPAPVPPVRQPPGDSGGSRRASYRISSPTSAMTGSSMLRSSLAIRLHWTWATGTLKLGVGFSAQPWSVIPP